MERAHQLVKSVVTRKAQAPEPTVPIVKYLYDAFERRIAKRDAFGTTRFAWDGNRLLCDACGQWTRTYVYEPGSFVPLAQMEMVAGDDSDGSGRPHCAVRHIHADHLGTPNEVTDEHGEITWASEYKAWGNTLRVVGVAQKHIALALADATAAQRAVEEAQPIRFLGQYHDSETGLHYNRFRYYDADCGRYVSLDPIGLAGGSNSYQYAPNPSGWTDPLGLAKGQCGCDGEGNSGEAHNAANFAKYTNGLRATEAANPLVESLRATRQLSSNYLTKQQAIQAGWKPGKALENSVPGGQLGGDIFQNTTGVLPSIWEGLVRS